MLLWQWLTPPMTSRPKPHGSPTPPPLPHTGCHLYEGPSVWFPGTRQTWSRCPAHRPPGSVDLGEVAGWCPACQQAEKETP